MNPKGFIIGLNVFILIIYILCFSLLTFSNIPMLFRMESLFFLLLLIITYPLLFLYKERWKYLILFSIRIVALFIIIRIMTYDYLLLLPLLFLPTISEIALFLQPKISVPLFLSVNLLLLISMFNGLGLQFALLFKPEYQATLIQLTSLTLLDLFVGLTMILMVYYREKIVELSNGKESLTNVVSSIMQNNMKLQFYAAKEGAEAAKKERQYITREIHDSVGYALSNTSMVLNAAIISDSNEEKERLIASAKDMTNQCLQETRSILHRLRLPEIEFSNNLLTIKKLIQTFEGATGINIKIHFTNFPSSVNDEIMSAFYRFIQVGLVNSFTHGRATEMRIILGMTEESLYVLLWDNGKGITQNFKKGIGIVGMTERLNSLGGSLSMKNCVDGFEIRASAPYKGKKL